MHSASTKQYCLREIEMVKLILHPNRHRVGWHFSSIFCDLYRHVSVPLKRLDDAVGLAEFSRSGFSEAGCGRKRTQLLRGLVLGSAKATIMFEINPSS